VFYLLRMCTRLAAHSTCTVTLRLYASCSTVGPMRHTRRTEFGSIVIRADFKHLRGNYDVTKNVPHCLLGAVFSPAKFYVMLNETNSLWRRFEILRVLLQFSLSLVILLFVLYFLCACPSLRTCNGSRGLQLLL
jgi:hypothetical protein